MLIGTHEETLSPYIDSKTNKPIKEDIINKYFHTDALNSVTMITDDKGSVLERRNYDAFGKLRNTIYSDFKTKPLLDSIKSTTRGFTSQEIVAGFKDLINMNARMYDAALGRFISADTIIQHPQNSQSYNRYSYIENNPLSANDPSGHGFFSWLSSLFKWFIKNIVMIAAVVVATVVSYGLTTYLMGLGGAWVAGTGVALMPSLATVIVAGAASGFAMGLIQGGNLWSAFEGAFWGAISAGAAFGVGHSALMNNLYATVGKFKELARALAHGLSRALINMARGGKAIAGFLGGFASSLMGGVVKYIKAGSELTTTVARTVASAIVGGTASLLGGGKFANGAFSGAFVWLFNHQWTYKQIKFVKVTREGMRKFAANQILQRSIRTQIRGFGALTYEEAYQRVLAIEASNAKWADELGLGLSIIASFNPAGMGTRFAVMALGIDLMQNDQGGIATGLMSMARDNIYTKGIDIGYGIYQVVK